MKLRTRFCRTKCLPVISRLSLSAQFVNYDWRPPSGDGAPTPSASWVGRVNLAPQLDL